MRGYLLQALDIENPIGFINRSFWLSAKKFKYAAKKITGKHPHINPDTLNYYTPVADVIGPASQHDKCVVSITFHKAHVAFQKKWYDMWEHNRELIANNPGLISMYAHKALYTGAAALFVYYAYWDSAQAYNEALSSSILCKILGIDVRTKQANLYRIITQVM